MLYRVYRYACCSPSAGPSTSIGSARYRPIPTLSSGSRKQTCLPHAALVVCHGGSGTTFGALAAGVPLVICPLFADHNAQLMQAAGAGLAVTSLADKPSNLRSLGSADVGPLREAIDQVLGEPAYLRAAERIGAEIVATPTLDDRHYRQSRVERGGNPSGPASGTRIDCGAFVIFRVPNAISV